MRGLSEIAGPKRNWGSNLCLVSLPAFMCLFLFLIQLLIANVLNARFKCGCGCPTEFKNPDGSCQPGKKVCGPQYTDKLGQIAFCEFPHPPAWPAFLQVPPENFRAADWGSGGGLPPSSCRVRPANFSIDQSTSMEGNGTYPCFNSVLYTGQNRRVADSIASKLIPDEPLFSLQTAKKKQFVMLCFPSFSLSLPPPLYIPPCSKLIPDVPLFSLQTAKKKQSVMLYLTDPPFNQTSPPAAAAAAGPGARRGLRRVEEQQRGGGGLGGLAGGFGNMSSTTGPNATNLGVFNFTSTSYMIPAITYDMAYVPPGSSTMRGWSLYLEEALVGSGDDWESAERDDLSGIECLVTLSLWRANTSNINDDLYKGYYQGNPSNLPNQYMSAYDFQNSSSSLFRTQIWYNSSYSRAFALGGSSALIRFPRSMNLAVNAFVKALLNPNATIPLLYLKDFPRPQDSVGLDSATLLGPLFYLWMLQLLYPVFTSSLVYEKEKNLRMMMRMHGLKDGPYWLISYSYFTIISVIFIAVFLIAGFIVQLKMFTANPVGLQLLAYGVFIFMQISFSVLTSTAFNNSKVATVVCYFYVFGSGLMANFLFRLFLDSESASTGVLIALQLIPAFSIYHCLYEFSLWAHKLISSSLSPFPSPTNSRGVDRPAAHPGLLHLPLPLRVRLVSIRRGRDEWNRHADVADGPNAGFFTAVLILAIEALVFLLVGLYLDQVVAVGSGVRKHPLLGLQKLFKKGKRQDARRSSSWRRERATEDKPDVMEEKLFKKGKRQDARRSSSMEEGAGDEDKPDVMEERALVDSLLHSDSEQLPSSAALLHHLRPSQEGVPMPQFENHLPGSCFPPVLWFSLFLQRALVDSLLHSDSEQPPSSPHYSIICDRLRKVYPGRDGNKQKVAVRDLSVAVARGECFGMLGPNGAGKTTTLSMMMGFLQPSEGAAIIEGMGIVDDMDAIYSIMGVCPQHDLLWEQLTGREHLLFYGRLKNLRGQELKDAVDNLLWEQLTGREQLLFYGRLKNLCGQELKDAVDNLLWEQLTGREHLLFYGRLKNLRGQELKDAVDKSLKSVNLLAGGVGDKVSSQYSGGMKRRLSVAISLIGNPLVVYG
ncbi:unnamed protein product [Closterium sp. NIES-64]|nr:unnamed protein product [Closterium sp. NIES-64]